MLETRRYFVFLAVGAFVGLVTVGLREILELFVREKTPLSYVITASVAYTAGVALAYILNSRITFSGSPRRYEWRQFSKFAGISCIGLCLTVVMSLSIRYGLRLDRIDARTAGTVAFATAALLSSAATYSLNAFFVFKKRNGSSRNS